MTDRDLDQLTKTIEVYNSVRELISSIRLDAYTMTLHELQESLNVYEWLIEKKLYSKPVVVD